MTSSAVAARSSTVPATDFIHFICKILRDRDASEVQTNPEARRIAGGRPPPDNDRTPTPKSFADREADHALLFAAAAAPAADVDADRRRAAGQPARQGPPRAAARHQDSRGRPRRVVRRRGEVVAPDRRTTARTPGPPTRGPAARRADLSQRGPLRAQVRRVLRPQGSGDGPPAAG